MSNSSSNAPRIESASPRHFSFSDSERVDANSPAQPVVQSQAGTLATPATVFVVDSAINSVLKQDMKTQSSPQPELQLPAGTEIVAHTTNAISSGLESPVVAVVDRNVKFSDTVMIPEGAHVIGHTAGAAKDRVNVR